MAYSETNLMLQAQTLPDGTPPMGKIHPISKIAIILEPKDAIMISGLGLADIPNIALTD